MARRKIGQLSFGESGVVAWAGSNDVLERLLRLVDWNRIETLLVALEGGQMGPPPYPPLMMFKALLLQRWYALSDPGLEEALKDRLSFRRFVGLALSEDIPDHSTLWRFREAVGPLSQALFGEVLRQIEASGFVMKQGTLIDASLIPAAVNPPKRPQEPLPPDADGRAASKLVKSALDPDAAWTKKGGKYHFGYKLHVAMDKTSRIIRRVITTPANINESQEADRLICGDEAVVYADKAYDSKKRSRNLALCGIENAIMRRGHPKRPLTRDEVCRNKQIARYRGAIEPIFHLVKNVHGFARARYRGLARNTTAFTLAAIAMNLKRWTTWRPIPA
jgi:IS5 family transposase